jgi:hypothetical protein
MKLYVTDTTFNTPQVKQFDTYISLVKYLDDLSKRKFGQNRKQRMIVLEEIGHGYDDPQAVNFVRSMAESFDMGVIRDNRLVRCDIPAVAFHQKEEFGD